jgi:hypothetical protein
MRKRVARTRQFVATQIYTHTTFERLKEFIIKPTQGIKEDKL